MESEHYYDVAVTWKKSRIGTLHSTVLPTTIEVATPPEFPKGIPGIWSPEHLLVAAVNSCLMTTFLAIAENSKLEFRAFQCKATGKLEKVDGQYLISEITLTPIVDLLSEEQRAKAEIVLRKSETACLITHSLKSKVTMAPQIRAAQVALADD